MSKMSLQHSVHQGVPPAVQALIWEVFFSSRGRGIDLQTHYPWIGDRTGVTSILIGQDDRHNEEATAAALIIKEETLLDSVKVGLVGLVCVNEAFRGNGLSHQLLCVAAEVGREKSHRSLILWTNKPNVYARHGFVVDSHDRYGPVGKHLANEEDRAFCHDLTGITVEDRSARGIPAFASRVMAFSSDAASITVLPTAQGHTLAEWTGDWDAIFQLIDKVLPARWNLNAPDNSEIYAELINRSYTSELQTSSQRMISNISDKDLPDLPYIPLLNRI